MGLFDKMFGSSSSRELKKIQPLVDATLALEDKFSNMSEDELRSMTDKLRDKLVLSSDIDAILPEAFATVREAAWRVLGMKHYPVQIVGGIVLHQGRIAEMKTGEGKTMVATLPAYLNALTGKGVHIVTVNDYLAKRDSEWMGKIYRYLGLTVGLVVHGMTPDEKRAAYAADITYGTNNEFGFDYLRDNMAIYKENMSQRGHNFAIVDEVDSILIDEARTPLIISGAGSKSTQMYEIADRFVNTLIPVKFTRTDDKADYDKFITMDYDELEMGRFITPQQHADLKRADYIIDEKNKNVTLTANGIAKAEQYFNVENLSSAENMELNHHIQQAIRAHGIMKKDIDYIVKDGQIIIVDEFTGRLMYGRRYNQGLHQAIEAKEHVKVEKESKTYASITLQNYFRMYAKLSGMTGTAMTEEDEFRHIYSLDVVEIPTNKPNIRRDYQDSVFKTEPSKFNAVIEQICECHQKGQPVLVGTISIEKSELLSKLLSKRGIKHQVLNAKHHEKEASIIAQAGKEGAVTIATNMAGRGTDIMLGGNAEYMAKDQMAKKGYTDELINEATGFAETDNEEIIEARKTYSELYDKYKAEISDEAQRVKDAGGLFIIGTERHESRRIDNQLRGRAARQGDPGSTRFFLSLDDDLMRLFGGERVMNVMNTLKVPDDMPIENKMLSSTIEKAQEKVEGINFQRRKSVLEYDDVMNKQREVIYNQRRMVLDGEDLTSTIDKMITDSAQIIAAEFVAGEDKNAWNLAGLRERLLSFGEYENEVDTDSIENADDAAELTEKVLRGRYARQKATLGEDFEEAQRVIMLRSVDRRWMDHIDDMDELKRGIGLAAYGQRDPVVEFKFQSYDIFEEMVNNIKTDTVIGLLSLVIKKEEKLEREQVAKDAHESHGGENVTSKTVVNKNKIGRNDPCPCGSGKKYKKCCGADK
ncbi:MAG: preprotein translocase subunit SecA [Clostridia bacterium]|nr:preprotein translocase subunit SecA [Clostridia bacterium]